MYIYIYIHIYARMRFQLGFCALAREKKAPSLETCDAWWLRHELLFVESRKDQTGVSEKPRVNS